MDAQPKILANLDFDIVAHLGYVKNVDLLTKGIYMVQIKLYYGLNGTTVAPVGMFSSPSTLRSEVQGQTLPQAPICSVCEVDDTSRTFRTRSFVVRYKDEKHELNDGVHWRLTVPSTQLSALNDDGTIIDPIGPHCSSLLHLKFELLFAPFVVEDPSLPKADLMHEIEKLVPTDPIFSVVATQNLVIENASSGIHSYYPVHFNGMYITELDCMIHCAMTGIRYPSLLPKLPILSSHSATEAVQESIVHNTDLAAAQEGERASETLAVSTPQKEKLDVENGASGTPDLLTRSLPQLPESFKYNPAYSLTPVRESEDRTEVTASGQKPPASRRYVPVMSPHSTLMSNPNDTSEGAHQASGGAMSRISGKISTWRRSVSTAITSPVPLMEKVGTIGATSKRGLNRLSTVLGSPIAEAAARFRHDHPTGASAGAGEGNGDIGDGMASPTAEEVDTKDNPLKQTSTSMGGELDNESLGALNLNAELNESDSNPIAVSSEETQQDKEEEAIKEDSLLDVLASRAEPIDVTEVISDRYDPLMNPERWISLYSAHVIENYAAALQGMSFILNLYEHLQNAEQSLGGSAETASSHQKALLDHCILETDAAAILTEVQECLDVEERLAILKEKLDLCNLQLTLHWSLLMTALRRVMTKLCPVLKKQYFEASKRFWRGQLLVHTKSIVNTKSYLPLEINQLLTIMGSQIRHEVTNKNKSITNGASMDNSGGASGAAASSRSGDSSNSIGSGGYRGFGMSNDNNAFAGSNCLWRGLQIYDADLHTNVSKLPHMLLQQYIGDTNAKPSLAELNARLAASHHKGDLEEPASCALSEAIKAVKELKKGPEDSLPAGSVFLARGGLLLDEARKLKSNMEIDEGEVVDLSLYPVLRPILATTLSSPKLSIQDSLSPTSPRSDLEADALVPQSNVADVDSASSARSELGFEEEESPSTPSQSTPASCSSKSSTSGRFSAKLNWADFSSTLASSTLPAEAVAVPARVGKLATSVPPNHVVVLQHGFLGQSYDMQLIENAIRLEFPGTVETFVAKSNEGKEQDSIAQMGKRLAFEVANFCKEHHPSLLRPGSKTKLSFIGHSMGGLIIRQALQESNLKPLLQNLHVYVSLATPHVGSLFPDSQIVSTGMWALFKWKKYKALKELILEDSIGGKAHKSLLYKLSENGVLTYFHKIILVSSPRDQYVPIYSARIQTGHKSESNNVMGTCIAEMVHNLLTPLRSDQLVRVTMDNNVGPGVDVNSLIGRTAHICYLENPVAAQLLVHTISAFFA